MKTILEVEQLTVKLNGRPIFPELSFEVQEAEAIGLVGASGSGKSLTTLAIGGLLPTSLSTSAQKIDFYTFGNERVSLLEQPYPIGILGKKIAYIFQEPSSALNPTMTCGEQILECTNLDKKSVLGFLEKVKFTDPEKIFESFPHQLSGGQQQRVMIAMAIANSPKLLIADEPTTALDATIQKSILDLLKDLQKEFRFGMILISHDVQVLSYMTDKVIPIGELHKATFSPNTIEIKSQNSSDEILLEFKNVGYSYTKTSSFFSFKKEYFTAIKGLNCFIGKHQRIALIGESGSGKSTIAKLLTGILEPTSGQICYFSTKKKSKIVQMVFQDYGNALSPRMTISQILKESIIAFDSNNKKWNETMSNLLQQVNLDEHILNKYPHQLSGGQKQRVSIARALASQPELLILDESLNALDIDNQDYIIDVLNRIFSNSTISLLYITHDLRMAEKAADWIGVMDSGELVEYKPTVEILKNPAHIHTKELINSLL